MTERPMQFMYTCRLCGKTYAGHEQTHNDASAVGVIMASSYKSTDIQPTAIHHCRENTFGISELIGCQPKETE